MCKKAPCYQQLNLKKLTSCTIHQQPFTYDAFTLDVKSVLNEILGGILGGTQC
jgi:hypothetical protein